ncbi:aspartate--tRNA(Asn) ligase, partial [Candidatus Dojkabacteria bacterium]|nr:aspartate--tRNA(Asn) ligase [Candidatus Dojkabacteria bacterium]
TGKVKEEPRSKYGVEVIDCKLNIISPVTEKLPLEINKPEIASSPETFYDNRPLVLRKLEERAIFKIQAELAHAYRSYLRENGFTEFFSPTLAGQ